MITPSFSLTATERVLPRMALDFTTASLDSRVTFTRTGNTATVTNSSGVIAAINANLPRFDFNPTTLVCKGLLIEESRTNLLLNSLLNGTSLSTQLVTTTAVSQTLSFYGTGQIVLTGTSSATVVGTGAYPARTTLTFTPTAGVLTLTVTGTVQYAQLETGAFATSFIPTAGSQVTRTADLAVMTGTNFSSWYNSTEGTISVECNYGNTTAAFQAPFAISDSTTNNMINTFRNTGSLCRSSIVIGGVVELNLALSTLTTAALTKLSIGYKLNNGVVCQDASAVQTDTTLTIPVVDRMHIGLRPDGSFYLNNVVSKIFYYPQRLINAEAQAITK
jgi:hypothetical protein